jgi:hypothetical protein
MPHEWQDDSTSDYPCENLLITHSVTHGSDP